MAHAVLFANRPLLSEEHDLAKVSLKNLEMQAALYEVKPWGKFTYEYGLMIDQEAMEAACRLLQPGRY